MTDAMKSDAIEDVLSSVRRLVSDHNSSQLDQAAGGNDRLVLTPELRVADAGEATQPETSEAGEVAEATAGLSIVRASDDSSEEEPEAEIGLEWSPDDRMSNWDDVGSELDDGASFEAEQGDPFNSDDTNGAVARAVAAAQSLAADEPETDQNQSDDEAENIAQPSVDDMQESDGEALDAEAASIADDENAFSDDLEQELAALNGIAEPESTTQPEPNLEAVQQAEAETFTPVFSRTTNPDVRVVDLAAQIEEPDGDDGLEDHVEDLGHRAAAFGFGDAETVMDEDALREIISQVVREELQGVLGQRITRNVRKMVRREIRMALAAEELE